MTTVLGIIGLGLLIFVGLFLSILLEHGRETMKNKTSLLPICKKEEIELEMNVDNSESPYQESEIKKKLLDKKVMNKKLNYWCFLILALIAGFFGLQEFYRGNVGLGILAVLFCWTCIPALVAFIESVVWLFKGPDEFNLKYN